MSDKRRFLSERVFLWFVVVIVDHLNRVEAGFYCHFIGNPVSAVVVAVTEGQGAVIAFERPDDSVRLSVVGVAHFWCSYLIAAEAFFELKGEDPCDHLKFFRFGCGKEGVVVIEALLAFFCLLLFLCFSVHGLRIASGLAWLRRPSLRGGQVPPKSVG